MKSITKLAILTGLTLGLSGCGFFKGETLGYFQGEVISENYQPAKYRDSGILNHVIPSEYSFVLLQEGNKRKVVQIDNSLDFSKESVDVLVSVGDNFKLPIKKYNPIWRFSNNPEDSSVIFNSDEFLKEAVLIK